MRTKTEGKYGRRAGLLMAVLLLGATWCGCADGGEYELDVIEKVGDFVVVHRATPNVGEGTNEVKGVVLHHTANEDLKSALNWLCDPKSNCSAHVVIGTDGTRYVLADPTQVTWHAGYSVMRGQDMCNDFTIGIEFVGNTCEAPLTEKQISSAMDYLVPLMEDYGLEMADVVTHKQVRDAWNDKHPENQKIKKEDITDEEHQRLVEKLAERMAEKDTKIK